MSDEPMDDQEARRRFVDYLVEVDARGPAPDWEEQSAAIFAEHEAQCDSLERELGNGDKRTRRS